MKVGDVVKDSATSDIVLIIAEGPIWKDESGKEHCWHFEVMYDNETYYVDDDDLERLEANEI